MNKKQTVGLVIAGLVFVFVCVSGVLSNYISRQFIVDNKSLTNLFKNSSKSYDIPVEPFVGVVKVEGTIANIQASMFETPVYNHQETLNYIDAMINSDSNRGILLYVDSPGGGVYESDELYLKLMEYKTKTERPIWTYMGSQACSGGYYIAMASDTIYANRNCWTGSIGVIISLMNLKSLYDKLGIEEINITSGKNKAMGSSGATMSEEHRDILQSLVDESYDQFVEIVANGRNMNIDEVKKIADGRIYSAAQALDLKLIDGMESYDNTVQMLKDTFDEEVKMHEPYTYSSDFFTYLFSTYNGTKSKSDAQILTEYLEKKGNGVLMYYAEPGQY